MAEYALGNTTEEARRLMRQAEYLAPHTRRTLQAAGVGPGKRVLDLGAGMGDVSLVCAELGAEVVAVERDGTTVERARARLAGKPVQVVQGVIPELGVDGRFDVICGRLILMYLRDPAGALREVAARHLAPGGAIAFVEYDFRAAHVMPTPALARSSIDALVRIFNAAGCDTQLGLRLPEVFAGAGFSVPSLDAFLWTGSTDDDAGFDMVAGVQAAIAPLAQRLGLGALIDPDLPSLPDRLRAATRAEGTLIGPLVVGAIARRA